MSRKLSSWKNKKIIVERTKTDIVGTIGEILFFIPLFFFLNIFFVLSWIDYENQYLFLLLQIIVLNIVILSIFLADIIKTSKKKITEELYIKEVKDE